MFSLIKGEPTSADRISDPVLLSLFEVLPDAAIVIDSSGLVQDANPAALKLFGFRSEDFINRPFQQLITDGQDLMALLPRREPSSAYRPPSDARLSLGTASGLTVEASITGCRVSGVRGEDLGAVVVLRDQRAAKTMSSRLAATEQRLKQALEAVEEGAWSADVKTGVAKVSARFAAMLGLPAADDTMLHLVQILEHVHPDEVELVRSRMTALARGDIDRFDDEIRLVLPEGGYQWVRNRGRVIEHDADGQPTRAAGLLREIDERKRLEFRARETEQLFREAMLAVDQTLWTTDFEAGVVRIEGPLVARLGKDGHSLVMTRERFRELVHPDDLKSSMEIWKNLVRSGGDSYIFTARMIAGGGDVVPVRVMARIAERDPQNRPVRATGFIQVLEDSAGTGGHRAGTRSS